MGGFSINNKLIQSKLLSNAIADAAGATFALPDPILQSTDLRFSQPQNATSGKLCI